MNSDLFPFEFLFMEKRERINWKKLKEFLSIFRSFFLSFFFPLILLLFFFGEKMRGNGERWEDKGDCLLEDNPFLQEHSTF